jgi:uncharacterized membrane protein YkoI
MRRLALLPVLLLSLTVPSAYASDDYKEARRLREAGEILPLETILQHARRAQAGKVLEVELDRKHGVYVYEFEVLDDDGVVWEVELDARDGAVLKHKRD